MPNEEELIARIQDGAASADSRALLGRWMRVPEAWAALRALDPSEVDRIQSPFDLAAMLAGRAGGSSTDPIAWREAEAAAIRPPADFHAVLRLAAALRQGMEAGLCGRDRRSGLLPGRTFGARRWRSPCLVSPILLTSQRT